MSRRIDWIAIVLIVSALVGSAVPLARAGCAGRCIEKSSQAWAAYIKSTSSRVDFIDGCIYRAWKDGAEAYAGPSNSCTNGIVYKTYELRSVVYSHACSTSAANGDLLFTTDLPTGPSLDTGAWACCSSSGTCYTNP
jgi:hypothetical protein